MLMKALGSHLPPPDPYRANSSSFTCLHPLHLQESLGNIHLVLLFIFYRGHCAIHCAYRESPGRNPRVESAVQKKSLSRAISGEVEKLIALAQCPFLTLRPFKTVRVVVSPNHEIVFLYYFMAVVLPLLQTVMRMSAFSNGLRRPP